VFNFKADSAMVACLQKAAIDVVNLANNHILDFGMQGLVDTLEALDHAHIAHVGAGLTIDDASQPVIVEKRGIRIGILGYTDNEPTWLAGVTTPGTNYVKIGDRSQLTYITQLKQHVDIVVVTIHWGPNMREYPTEEFRDFAHAMIDAGADIIHGHSAHIVQPIERYRGKLIMYDTGDFVDDYAVDPQLRNDLSFIFLVTIDKNATIKNIDLVPIQINMMQVNQATESNLTWLKKRMKIVRAKFT
jgi:poly-gamma-glutamate synthesis protein (capsule biosynthesis protein)